MRSAFRLLMASFVLTVAAGFAGAQEPSEQAPLPAPDAVVPVAELPPIPSAAAVQDPDAPAVDPALTLSIDPSALAVAPAAVAIVQAPPEPANVVVTTTTRRVASNTAKQPVEKPVTKPQMEPAEASNSVPPRTVPASANVLETLAPPVAGASTAPAAVPPAAKSVIVETPTEGTEFQTSMGIGGWLLAGIVVAAMVGLITFLRRRWMQKKITIPQFPDFELKPVPVRRS